MKMDEHARAWGHEFVAQLLNTTALPPEQRNSLHWEILSHLHEKAERRVETRGGNAITLADLQATVQELGGRDGIAGAFLQTRLVATPRAGLAKRFGGLVIDVVICAMAFAFIGIVFINPIESAIPFRYIDLFPLSFFVLWFVYNVVAEFRWGATIGKAVFKLRTVMADGKPITSAAAMIRNVSKAFPPLFLVDVLVYLVAFYRDDQRGSDRLANTIVVDTTKTAWTPPPAPLPPVASTPPAPAKNFIPVQDPADAQTDRPGGGVP